MASQRRSRRRRAARGAPFRVPRRRLLVLCEGKVTEPEYIRGLDAWVRNASVVIEIPRECGPPLSLVRCAVQRMEEARRQARRAADSFLEYDEGWCVFDVDAHPFREEAAQLAKTQGIQLAVSNPCFELWLLLHFRQSPGPQHGRVLQRMMRTCIPNYQKSIDFSLLLAGVETAVVSARWLDKEARAINEAGCNPSTGMHLLVDSVRRDGPP